nr:MAG TPA: repressor domain protein [Caudoviricetes sp.]
MNNLKVFESPDLGKVRVVERSGEPWFVAADVCRALGLDSTGKALTRLDDDEKGVNSIHTLGGSQMMTIINESGLYALVLGSRKPEAKAFKRWVTHEVLPAIRRTGRYQAGGVQPITPAMALEAAQLLHGCQPAALPCIHKLLTDAGFILPPLGLQEARHGGAIRQERKARFGRWFDAECMRRYATALEAAEALGTSDANIYRWRSGQCYPQPRLLQVIINNFGPMPEVMEE